MIVAMPAVGVMQMATDQVVGVIAMRDRRVTAAGAVYVVGGVSIARMIRSAAGWVGRVDRDRAFIDVVAVHHVQMTIVEVVDVATVLDREMAAVGTMDVVVGGVREMCRHTSSYEGRTAIAINATNDEVMDRMGSLSMQLSSVNSPRNLRASQHASSTTIRAPSEHHGEPHGSVEGVVGAQRVLAPRSHSDLDGRGRPIRDVSASAG